MKELSTIKSKYIIFIDFKKFKKIKMQSPNSKMSSLFLIRSNCYVQKSVGKQGTFVYCFGLVCSIDGSMAKYI